MLMSIAASIAADGVAPRLGPRVGVVLVVVSVDAHAAINDAAIKAPAILLCEYIADASVGGNTPGLDVMIVIIHAGRVLRYKRSARRLHIAFFVGSAALQRCGSSRPFPRQSKARETLGKNRALQRRGAPACTAIARAFHFRDLARA